MDTGDTEAGPAWVGLARKLLAEQIPLQPGEIGQRLQPLEPGRKPHDGLAPPSPGFPAFTITNLENENRALCSAC